MPEILQDYLLCMMYQCLPSQLDEQDHGRVQRHWLIHNEIARIRSLKKK